MSRSPPISILLPVRNGAEHLPESIASLRAQSWSDYEVLAVDDGSTDGTARVLARWAREDPRVRVFLRPARGIGAALETARSRARGRFLARMDADDVARPRRLERQLATLTEDASLAGCGAGVRYFPRETVKSGAARYERWLNGFSKPDQIERDIFVECPLAHPTFFLRADVVEQVGGYRAPGWPEDYDLVLRIWAAGGRLASVSEILLDWRDHPDRLSRRHTDYSTDAFRRCKIHYLRKTLLAGRDGAVVWGSGPTGKRFARILLAEGVPLRAFIDLDPRKIGRSIYGAPVEPPGRINAYRGALALAAVGQPGARAEIRTALTAAGWREMIDFVAVA